MDMQHDDTNAAEVTAAAAAAVGNNTECSSVQQECKLPHLPSPPPADTTDVSRQVGWLAGWLAPLGT